MTIEEMSTISKDLFEELKQRTVNCVNQQNYESIESLRQFVNKCDNNFINSLYQYSIFPLRLIIANLPKKQNCDKVLESSVECLSLILQKSKVNRFDIFADIFANLFHLIDDNRCHINDEEFVFKPNEDIILSVIKCSKSLIESCEDSLLTQLLSPSFSAQLGHSIHILLNTANNQKYSLVKVEAIETIDCLIKKCQLSQTQDCGTTSPQDLIAYFLPGISINISKLITSDDKLNRRVISSCLSLLSNTIVFVFKSVLMDSEMESKKIDSKQVTTDSSEVIENNMFVVIRDQKWLENSCVKLNIVFEKIVSTLISHQNWNVRQSLAQFVMEILSNCCSLFITNCLIVLIRVPLTYLNDDFEQIVVQCDSFVTTFAKSNVSNDSSKTYLDLIEDQIYSYITRLPRIIRTCSEREKITSIYLLYGYLKCLDINGLNYLVYSVQHKQKLFECLIDVCCLDYRGIRLLEQVTHSDKISLLVEEQLPQKWIRKNSLYLNDEKSVTALTQCCQLVAKRVEPQVLIDYWTDVLTQSKLNPSVLFVANIIISNISADYTETQELLELYLTNISSTIEDRTIEHMNKDILRQCLLIEGLTAFLHLYNSESSPYYLLKCAFPLLESVGASNESIFETSYRALTLVSQHFDYTSISELIAHNIDYLMNSICIHLKHFIDNQSVPIVIKVMLKYSTQDMLHLFVDAIHQIIVVIDCHHKTQSLPLMQVLYAFVCTLSHYFVPKDEVLENQVISSDKRSDSLEKRAQNLIQHLEEFVKNRNICKNFENENQLISSDNEEEECDDKEVKDENKEPFYVEIVENILSRCVHIMSDTDSRVRLIVLDIVIQSLRILKPFQDHLLPMAHKLWSPLVERFTDKDVIVIKRSFSCLSIMSQSCGDFIRVRTVKEVMPKILSFLRSQSQLSFKKDKASAYRFTIAYQFQMDILCGIGLIAVNLDLCDKDLWQLIADIIPYLSAYQPIPLQESAIIALKKISELDANSVFYYLKMTYSSDTITGISNNEIKPFPDLRFEGNKKEFAKNVTKLLDYLSFN